MKKLFNEQTLYIENGVMLEEVRDVFFKKGVTIRWGYDETYVNDDTVSSGYLHFDDGVFYLSKKSFDKPIITMEQFLRD